MQSKRLEKYRSLPVFRESCANFHGRGRRARGEEIVKKRSLSRPIPCLQKGADSLIFFILRIPNDTRRVLYFALNGATRVNTNHKEME